jgi:VanZ family protein
MKKIIIFWETIAWTILMLVLFLLPPQDVPDIVAIPHQDKFAHIILFMVFTMLYLRSRLKTRSLKTFVPGHIFTIFLIVLLFAISVEFLQYMMHAGREGDITDILHDFAGFTLGSLIMMLIYGSRSL